MHLVFTQLSHSELETRAIAEEVAKLISPPCFLFLKGDLGAGKTHFVKGLAQTYGIASSESVHSPTFNLIHHYSTQPLLIHVDLYRLNAASEVHELALEDFLEQQAIVAIEWPERLPHFDLEKGWLVEIKILSSQERQISLFEWP